MIIMMMTIIIVMPVLLWFRNAQRAMSLVNSTKKSLIVATRLWLDSAKFKVNSVNDVIS